MEETEPDNKEKAHFSLDALRDMPVLGAVLKKFGPRIPVLRLSGVLADGPVRRNTLSYAHIGKMIEKAFSVKKAPAVALIINSPGGAPAQAQLIAGAIRALAIEKNIPVHAFVEDVAASGGYWLACAADTIHVQESSIVGSIGVISAGFGFEDFIARHGIKRRLYTAGQEKSLLDSFSPERTEDVTRLRDLQKEIHTQFITWVRTRRGEHLNGRDEELFEGRFWTGTTARDLGLVDSIGDVRSVLREKYGENIRFAPVNPAKRRFSFLPLAGQIETITDDFLNTLEYRNLWARFGL